MSKILLRWYATEEMKKNHAIELETVNSFLSRGGKIQTIGNIQSMDKRKTDAQKLLNNAIGTPYEQEVINFLRKQGIQIEEL